MYENKKKLVVICVSVFLIVALSVVFINHNASLNIKGMVADDGSSSSGADARQALSKNDLGDTSTFKNINVKADVIPESYNLSLENKDLEIVSGSVFVKTADAEMDIKLNESMILIDFIGELTYKDEEILLHGKASGYSADSLKIRWPEQKDISVKIGSNFERFTIKDVRIESLNAKVTGSVELYSKITMNLERDSLKISNFFGNLEIRNNDNFILEGVADEVSVQTEGFGLKTE